MTEMVAAYTRKEIAKNTLESLQNHHLDKANDTSKYSKMCLRGSTPISDKLQASKYAKK